MDDIHTRALVWMRHPNKAAFLTSTSALAIHLCSVKFNNLNVSLLGGLYRISFKCLLGDSNDDYPVVDL